MQKYKIVIEEILKREVEVLAEDEARACGKRI